jgi:hypothetical protein
MHNVFELVARTPQERFSVGKMCGAERRPRLPALIAAPRPGARKRDLLSSVPSTGLVVLCSLIAELPELASLDHKQIAVALAPFTLQCGQWRGESSIDGDRASLRRALFMGAMDGAPGLGRSCVTWLLAHLVANVTASRLCHVSRPPPRRTRRADCPHYAGATLGCDRRTPLAVERLQGVGRPLRNSTASSRSPFRF